MVCMWDDPRTGNRTPSRKEEPRFRGRIRKTPTNSEHDATEVGNSFSAFMYYKRRSCCVSRTTKFLLLSKTAEKNKFICSVCGVNLQITAWIRKLLSSHNSKLPDGAPRFKPTYFLNIVSQSLFSVKFMHNFLLSCGVMFNLCTIKLSMRHTHSVLRSAHHDCHVYSSKNINIQTVK